jgi:TPR repeat protein
MSLRFPIALVLSIICLAVPSVVGAEVQTLTATHTYVLGDHDSKDDARQRCLLETKRKILEQAGVYIESESEVRNFDLTKDTITSVAAAVMQIKDTKENFGFESGHMKMTLTTTAQVDITEVRKQLAARQVDASVRGDGAVQKERLKRLETQLEAMQRETQKIGQVPGRAPASSTSDILAAELLTEHKKAAQGDVDAQLSLGTMYEEGKIVPQDFGKARWWYEQAAAQGDAQAQTSLGTLYVAGRGVPLDFVQARQWWEQAAAQGDPEAQNKLGVLYDSGHGVPQDDVRAYMWYSLAVGHAKYAEGNRDSIARRMTPAEIAEAQRLAREWKPTTP